MSPTSPPTALVVSQSALDREPWMSHSDEYARVLTEILDADLVQVGRRSTFVASRLHDRFRIRNALAVLPWTRTFELHPPRRRYDLAVVVVNNLDQLGRIAAMPRWRGLARRRIAIATEAWPPFVEQGVVLQRMRRDFDHLFIGVLGVVDRVRELSGTDVSFLPPAADVLAVEVVAPDRRPFDVVNLGRRDPSQHRVLEEWASGGGRYHSPAGPPAQIRSHRRQRHEYLSTVASGRFHVANHARFDDPHVSCGLREYGYRYFEALAAGAIVVGDHPTGPVEHIVFPGGTPFLEFPVGARSLPSDLARTLGDPTRIAELAARHRNLALTEHDVLHRWERMSAAAGLDGSTPGAARRRAELERRRDNEPVEAPAGPHS
jgi:hypothetical protein